MSFDNQSIVPASARGRALRICILDVAAQHTLDRTVTTSPPADDEQHNSDDVCGASHKYPHDAHAVLRCMYPDATIDIVELKPDARRSIAELRRLDRKKYDLFVNLYDLSDDTGQKIVEFMEHRSIPFTGAGGRFYDPTRELLKMHCRYAGLDTPMFMLIDDAALLDSDDEAVRIVEELGGFPLFIKPEHGYDSVGIDQNSVVHSVCEFRARVATVIDHWGCALVEKFIDGREFSVLIVGDKSQSYVYAPVEYKFDATREKSAFITFDDKWVSYENRWSLLDAASSADTDLIDKIKSIATRLFVAFEAEGYARIDLRQDRLDGRLHVLDINPNCSVFYRDSCTADSIVEQDGCGKQHLMHHMIAQAWRRSARSRASNKSQVRYHPKRGFSLHAACDIKQDDVVYSDEMGMLRVVTRDFADKHWSAAEMSDFDRYAWPIGPQTFAIWSPDARDWKPINHSCDPNCWMHGLETRARRDIAQGDELTLDYSVFEPYHPPFQCWCGAAQCEGVIKPNRHTDPAFVAKYAGHCSPFMEHLIADHVQKCGLD